ALSSITDDQIRIWFNDKTIKPELEQALHKIVEQKNLIAGLDQQVQTRQTQISAISLDQQRLRENMKALQGSVEEKALLQRYTKELNDQEDKLQTARAEIDSLAAKRAEGNVQLNKLLSDLSLDETL